MSTLALTHPEHDQLLTVQEFASLVRAHPKSIYRRIALNQQPGAVKVGREHRINVRIALTPAPRK